MYATKHIYLPAVIATRYTYAKILGRHTGRALCICIGQWMQNYSHFGQWHVLQNTTLIFRFYKNIYQNVIYVYFYENIFQDKSIHIIFIFSNSTIWELFMIYISKIWLKFYPKQLPLRVWREYWLYFICYQMEFILRWNSFWPVHPRVAVFSF